MAKGKKSESTKSPEASEAPSAAEARNKTAKGAGESGAAKPAAARGKSTSAKKAAKGNAASAGAPLIDTNLAAQTAARMLAQRNANQAAAGGSGSTAPARESSTFQRLKGNAGNSPAGLSNILGGAPDHKKSQQNFGGGKQTGRNQSFGSAGKHFGVPRRTSG